MTAARGMLDSIEPLECACGATAVGPRQGRAMAALAIARASLQLSLGRPSSPRRMALHPPSILAESCRMKVEGAEGAAQRIGAI